MESADITPLALGTGEREEWQRSGRGRLRRWMQPPLVAGLVMIVIALVVTIFAPLIAHNGPDTIGSSLLSPPSGGYPFGTDEVGRDVFSRVIYAGRSSLPIAFGAVAAALALGAILGITSGYAGRWIDIIIMRILDILFAFPAILFAVALVAALGPSTRNLILTIAILYTPRFARVARAPTLAVKERDFVTGARALGAGNLHIVRSHILPNILSPLIVESSLSLTIALLTEAALSFLGLGIQPPDPSWGSMISTGRTYLLQAPWYVIFPGLAIMYCVLAFNLLGDGLRDVLDPTVQR